MAMGNSGSTRLLATSDDASKTGTTSLSPVPPVPSPQPMAARGPTPGDITVARRADSSATTALGTPGSTRGYGRGGQGARAGGVQLLGDPTGGFREDPAKLGSIIQDPNDPRRQQPATGPVTDRFGFNEGGNPPINA